MFAFLPIGFPDHKKHGWIELFVCCLFCFLYSGFSLSHLKEGFTNYTTEERVFKDLPVFCWNLKRTLPSAGTTPLHQRNRNCKCNRTNNLLKKLHCNTITREGNAWQIASICNSPWLKCSHFCNFWQLWAAKFLSYFKDDSPTKKWFCIYLSFVVELQLNN